MGFEAKLEANGRVLIPADVRRRLGYEAGERLHFEERDDGLHLTSRRQRIAGARKMAREIMKDKPRFTVEEYLREKRADVAREEAAEDG